MTKEKDREATQKRLLEAVGELIRERGLELLGINAVAERAGVSKVLIYRYFGSLEELIASYIRQKDFWVNLPAEVPDKAELNPFIKKLFAEQIRQMREDKLLIRLLRWELSTDNPLIEEIRRKREQKGVELIGFVTRISGLPYAQVQVIATLLSSSVTYLALYADTGDLYNGLHLQREEGWQQLEAGIEALIDQWIPPHSTSEKNV